MKRTIALILFLVVLFISFIPVIMGKYQESLDNSQRSVTVVLDAGHGGIDGGASSASGIVEKEVVLSVTKNKINAIVLFILITFVLHYFFTSV